MLRTATTAAIMAPMVANVTAGGRELWLVVESEMGLLGVFVGALYKTGRFGGNGGCNHCDVFLEWCGCVVVYIVGEGLDVGMC
jgi:hypothetical protein